MPLTYRQVVLGLINQRKLAKGKKLKTIRYEKGKRKKRLEKQSFFFFFFKESNTQKRSLGQTMVHENQKNLQLPIKIIIKKPTMAHNS